MKEIFTIDRFECNIAVCENNKTGEIINIEIEKLPKNIKEGSIVKLKKDRFILDIKNEEKISKRIKEKMDNLWN